MHLHIITNMWIVWNVIDNDGPTGTLRVIAQLIIWVFDVFRRPHKNYWRCSLFFKIVPMWKSFWINVKPPIIQCERCQRSNLKKTSDFKMSNFVCVNRKYKNWKLQVYLTISTEEWLLVFIVKRRLNIMRQSMHWYMITDISIVWNVIENDG